MIKDGPLGTLWSPELLNEAIEYYGCPICMASGIGSCGLGATEFE